MRKFLLATNDPTNTAKLLQSVKTFWPSEDGSGSGEWFQARIVGFDLASGQHKLEYPAANEPGAETTYEEVNLSKLMGAKQAMLL